MLCVVLRTLGGKLVGAIPTKFIGRVSNCQVPKEVGCGFEVVKEVEKGDNEIFVFAVRNKKELA